MNTECTICLTNNIIAFNKCITQCNHNFCKKCLDTWFDQGKNTCPMCRQSLQYFTYNGLSTRVISVEKEQIIPPGPNIPVVTVTKSFYNSMKYITMMLISANIIELYIISQDCDI